MSPRKWRILPCVILNSRYCFSVVYFHLKTLNATKCEVAFFSLDYAEAQWRPQITIYGVPPSCTPTPTYLGVTYDRRMTFGTQVKKVCQQLFRRTNLLRVVGGTTWGWQKQELRTVYIATQRSVAEYAAAAWTPWLSTANIEELERTQLQSARAITHHVHSTPTEAVLHEADLPRLEHRFKTLSVLQANKWNSLDAEDPRRVVLNDSVRLRPRRPDWRTTVLAALSSLGLLTYHPGDHSPPRPMTGSHRRHPPNRHSGVHRWVHPRRYHWWGSRDGGYEWGRHHRTMACPKRPMEQLVPSGEISDGKSNLEARWVRGLAIGVGALRQQVPYRNPCEL